jgi:hypothetical protein
MALKTGILAGSFAAIAALPVPGPLPKWFPNAAMAATKGLVASRAEDAAIGHGRLSPGALRSRELLRGATVRVTTGTDDRQARPGRGRAANLEGERWIQA